VRIRHGSIVAVITACCALLSAQDLERFKPKEPKPERDLTRENLPTPQEGTSVLDDVALVKELRGIVFLSDPGKVQTEGVPVASLKEQPVQAEGLPLLQASKARAIVSPYLGKPVSLGSLNSMCRELVLYYRDAGHPVVDVSLPPQDITSGVVQIVIIEGRVGDVRTEGNHWFSEGLLVRGSRLVRGQPITSVRTGAALDWLNSNPFRSVDVIYAPGATLGETDILLKVEDRFPLRVFAGFDNAGVELTNENEMYAGFNYGNLWGLDHQLSYQFTADPDVEKLLAHSASYTAPLPWGHFLRLFGAYVESTADLDMAGIPIELGGTSWQGSMIYDIPLRGTPRLKHDLELGFDYKHSDNDLEFGGIRASGDATDIFQFVAAHNATVKDRFGATRLRTSVAWSPGNWNAENTDEAFEAVRAGADSTYWHGRVELERLTRLPWDFTLWLRASYQWADGNLLPSEQLLLGGHDTVRGFPERVLRGDEGWLITAELRTPAIKPLQLFGSTHSGGEVQFLAFWDYGQATNRVLLPMEEDGFVLSSAGLGVRYTLARNVSVRFDYGWQIDDGPGFEDSSQAHFGIEVSY
jgi:hemolysin activation/secretion protein